MLEGYNDNHILVVLILSNRNEIINIDNNYYYVDYTLKYIRVPTSWNQNILIFEIVSFKINEDQE